MKYEGDWSKLRIKRVAEKGENGNRKSEKCLETNLMKPQNRLLGAVLRAIAI